MALLKKKLGFRAGGALLDFPSFQQLIVDGLYGPPREYVPFGKCTIASSI